MKYIAYIGSIVFIVALVLIIRGFKKKDKTNFKRDLIILIVSFIIVGLTGKYVPTSTTKIQHVTNTEKKEAKETVKKETSKPVVKKNTLEKLVSKNFNKGKLIGDKDTGILTIQFKVIHTNENDFVTQMIYEGKMGLEKVYKNDEFKKYKLVMLKGMTDFTDKYGKTTEDVGMKLTFAQSELQKVVSFDNISKEQFILLQGENKTYLHPSIGLHIKQETYQLVFPTDY